MMGKCVEKGVSAGAIDDVVELASDNECNMEDERVEHMEKENKKLNLHCIWKQLFSPEG